ncbi:hypothetical protein LX36DRAFT_291816 [Colletotrichum falcatum]|nr:hypothetical protein LX36DRAFT_291816 [Colletotrichum falcatum]
MSISCLLGPTRATTFCVGLGQTAADPRPHPPLTAACVCVNGAKGGRRRNEEAKSRSDVVQTKLSPRGGTGELQKLDVARNNLTLRARSLLNLTFCHRVARVLEAGFSSPVITYPPLYLFHFSPPPPYGHLPSAAPGLSLIFLPHGRSTRSGIIASSVTSSPGSDGRRRLGQLPGGFRVLGGLLEP